MGQVPPINEDLERLVVGAAMQWESALLKIGDAFAGIKNPFYFQRYRVIYEIINSLYRNGVKPDIVAVTNALKRLGQLKQAGGTGELAAMMSEAVSDANIEYYAGELVTLWKKRELLAFAKSVQQEIESNTAENLLVDAQIRLDNILNASQAGYDDSPDVTADTTMNYIQALVRNEIQTIQSYYTGFNIITGGYQDGDFIVLAARPSIGKTAYILTELRYQSYKKNIPTAFLSLDSVARNIMFRVFAQESTVPVKKLRLGMLNEVELEAVVMAKQKHSEKKMIIDDRVLNINDLYGRIRRLIIHYGVKMIAVDYIQLVDSGKNEQTREREIAKVSSTLKRIAKEFGVVIVALSQLNRGVESRPDKRPMLSDTRDSGSIEQDADIVLLLHRPEFYGIDYFDKDHRESSRGMAEIIIAKGRDVGTGTFKVGFKAKIAKFTNQQNSTVYASDTLQVDTDYSAPF